MLNLELNPNDWGYIIGAFPTNREHLRIRGMNQHTFNAYFYIAIGIEIPDTSGCPVTFGQSSQLFCLQPQNTDNGSSHGVYNSWCWRII
jgi:hypothetical protein